MMVYTILVARALGPEQFGKYSGTYALTGLTIFAVNWGMDTLLLREPGSLANPRAWAGRVLRIKMGAGLVWAAVLVIAAPLIRPDVFSFSLVLVCALDIWADSAVNTLAAELNIQKRIRAVSRLIFLSRAARLVGGIGLVIFGVQQPLVYATTRAMMTMSSLLIAIWVVRPVFNAAHLPTTRELIRMSTPYGLSEMLVLIYMQADVTLLTLLKGSEAAGVYSPASGLINALFIIPTTLFFVIVPPLSSQYLHDRNRLRSSIIKITFGFFGLGVVLALGVGLTGGWIIRMLLGAKYAVTSVLLVTLSPLLFFKSLGFGWAAFLVAVGWQKQRLIPQVVSAVANVLFNLWAIPRLGVAGVAVVYVATEIILAAGYAGLVINWFRRNQMQVDLP